jgi:hypothetical protein
MAKVSRFRQATAGADDLVKRTEESYRTKDSSGKYENYLAKNMPLPTWKCKDGDHVIDIIPWLAGDGLPGKLEKGKGTYFLDLWSHQHIGVNECSYLCLARNFNKPCPICEDVAEMKKKAGYDEKYVKSITAKRRVVYAIMVYDSNKETEAGPFVWEASHWLTEKNIAAIARNRRTGGYVAFANPDTGKSIEFTKEGTGENTKYTGFKFTDRDYTISEETLEAVPPLDEYLIEMEYDELLDIYKGSGGGEEEGDEDENMRDSSFQNENDKPIPSTTGRRETAQEDPPDEKEQETPHTPTRMRTPLRRNLPQESEDNSRVEEKEPPAQGRIRAPLRRSASVPTETSSATSRTRIGRRAPQELPPEDDVPF